MQQQVVTQGFVRAGRCRRGLGVNARVAVSTREGVPPPGFTRARPCAPSSHAGQPAARDKVGDAHFRTPTHTPQPLGAIFGPRAAEEGKVSRPAQRPNPGLCCRGFRASITGRPSTPGQRKGRARNGGRGGGATRGHAHPLVPPGRAPWRRRRRGARSRVPSDARRDTKGWRESAERGRGSGMARPGAGPERTRARSRARRSRALGRGAGRRTPGPPAALPAGPGGPQRAGAARGAPGASIFPRAA